MQGNKECTILILFSLKLHRPNDDLHRFALKSVSIVTELCNTLCHIVSL